MQVGRRLGSWQDSGGWVNPYITDGLIAMWDTIDGHDGLTDIVGGVELVGDATIGDDGRIIIAKKQISSTVEGLSGYDGLTVDLCAKFNSFSGGYGDRTIFNFGGLGAGFHGSLGTFRCTILAYKSSGDGYIVKYGGGNQFAANTKISMSLCQSVIDYGSGVDSSCLIVGGNLVNQSSTGFLTKERGDGITMGSSSVGFEIYCVRLYNRQLNQSEIADNYAVDKTRFGIA